MSLRGRLRTLLPALTLLAAPLLLGGCGGEPTGEPLTVTVPNGATMGVVADTLSDRGIVDHPTLFRLYARARGADTGIRAGRYAFRRGESWSELVEDLTSGRVLTTTITIPEGFNLQQMAPRIAAVTGLPPDTVLARLTADTTPWSERVPGPDLEGYLFPDTYRFAPGSSLERVMETMLRRYEGIWTEERRARLDSVGMTEREAVTLASIIQAEARLTGEMPRISAVYHNRLEIGYPLQADPTVLHALGGRRDRLLYAAIDSVADHPYNTYTQPGLPPGPINSPGEAAIDAALNPADVDHLYFVARPDGSHVFTRHLTEHNRAKVEAQAEWERTRDSVRARSAELADTVPPPEGAEPDDADPPR